MIGSRLAHYRILDLIGEGGMGVVYRAHDEQLERDVAVKVLTAGSLDDPAARKRFKQEALALAQINHPNIATVYGVGAENGVDYLVMEFIPGASLADRLLVESLPIPEVINLAVQVAEGLSAAHKRGIIHRDLKPGNIRLTPEGRIKILDFGLARRAPRASDEGLTVTSTQVHETSGTIPYMPPEQLRGQVGDERSDLWAFGAVLYELSCGERPFRGLTAAETAADIIHKPTPSPRAIRSEIPEGLETIIHRCLEKEPARRYSSADVLLADLAHLRGGAGPASGSSWLRQPANWIKIAAAILLIAAAAVVVTRSLLPRPAQPSGQARRSVAVLGFKNLKGVATQDWISTALSEMLTTELAAGEDLRAVPGEDVARARMDLNLPESESLGEGTLRQVRDRLGSDLVVVGSYLDLGGQIRVDIRLQDAATGNTVANLAESGPEDQLFQIVNRAGAALRAHCGVGELSSNQLANVRASQPANLAAARLYAEGLGRLRQFDAAGARDKFEAAINADPKDALSHAALASAWSQLGYDARAAQQAKVAFDLSGNLTREDRLVIEGAYHTAGKEWDKAIDVYRTLYGYFPDRPDYGLNLADAQVRGGKAQDALATVARLRESSKGDPRIDLAEGRADAALSDYRRASEANARAIEAALRQGSPFARAQALQQQCWASRNLGEMDEALEAGRRSQAIFEENHNARGEARSLTCIGNVLSDKGDLASAQQMYERALALVQGIGARLDIAGALNNIGNVLVARGRLEDSTAKYQQSLAVAVEIDDKPDQLRAQSNIAGNLMALAQFRKAQTAQQSALDIARSIGDRQGTAETLINLASVCLIVGEIASAEQHAQEALEISRSLGLRPDVAYSLTAVGDVQLAKDDLAAAAQSYTESLAIRKQLGEPSSIAAGQLSLANAQVERGDLDQALQGARDAATQLHTAQDAEQEATARNTLARILLLQRKPDLAQAEIEAVRKVTITDRTSPIATDIAYAGFLAQRGRYAESKRLLEQAAARAKSMDYQQGALQASVALGETLILSGDASRGTQALQAAADQASRQGYRLLQRKALETAKITPPRTRSTASP